MDRQVELLAPAKNFMALKASGPYADAVYLGLESYNMRMQADNFTLADLDHVVSSCHHPPHPHYRPRKVYLTLNTLIYDQEIPEIEQILILAKASGIDAVIVDDMAILNLAKKHDLPFHISTQVSVSNSLAAQYYEKLGAERIILARECSLAQIKHIASQLTTTSIEAFIHGAMCSSISGRCYLSQTIEGSEKKSANRGQCSQPCRGEWILQTQDHEFIYDGERIFNSRDLCMINYIPELIEAGITAFKIEGRMRHPHYVETVTRVYREAIDAYYAGTYEKLKKTARWVTRLKQVYNRGFTTGFYFNQATIEDSQLHSPANVSHFRYIEMGRIIETFPTGIARIKLTNGSLAIGDEIIVMSTDPQSDTYFTQKIHDLQYESQKVHETPKATITKPVIITTKMDELVNHEIDAIYKFTEETYRQVTPRRGKKRKKPSYNL